MGFFDFLTAKAKTTEGPGLPEALTQETSSTRLVHALLAIPKAERDEAWKNLFLAHVAEAAFYGGDPRIVQGADHFPYFALYSPKPLQAYPSHILHHMKDDFLLDQGLGIVINPDGPDADWAFSYGDLLNYHLNGVFYPAQSHLASACAVEPESSPAPEERLPPAARKALRTFLQGLGVAEPGVRLAAWDGAGPGSLELVFKFSPQDFASVDAFRMAMSSIYWFLPRNYSYSVAGKEARDASAFVPL